VLPALTTASASFPAISFQQTAIEQFGFLSRASVGFSSMPATPSDGTILIADPE
jgi:hypothetical protein